MIELEQVSKRYGETYAVKPLDLKLAVGSTVALIGPSGCGKSTLLRLMVGLIRPDSGRVTFGGEPLTDASVVGLRRQLGYVVQDGGLFPHLTAKRNVTLMARELGWTEDEIQTRVKELSELTQFPVDGLNRYPAELSGGQKQRVSLMRALMLRPKVLLLDEPLGALDPMVRAGLQADLKEIFRALGQTVVFVTHDMGEAAYLADEIILMREGAIVQRGNLEAFQQQPVDFFVTQFLSAQRSLVAL